MTTNREFIQRMIEKSVTDSEIKERTKMNWLIKKNGLDKNKLWNTDEDMGTIMIPTGGGKSALMFENIIRHMRENALGKKMIFVLNGPQLKIISQTTNDALRVICADNVQRANGYNKDEIMFFINSSDTGESYENVLFENELSAYPFVSTEKTTGIEAFLRSDTAKYAIVASCNKSLYKIDARIAEFRSIGIETIVYLDEAHTLTIDKNADNDNEYSEESRTFVDFSKLCNAKCVYAFSATPEQEITAEINKYNGHNGEEDYYIIKESPEKYIKDNIIVPPLVTIKRVDDDYSLNYKTCEDMMRDSKKKNQNINHKILVTANSWSEVESLENSLVSRGNTVFSTCVKLGMRMNGEKFTVNGNDGNVIQFINTIDSWDGDCFVIHIKQLTAGIDIKSLTGCIIVNRQHGDNSNYRKYIQIIGRTLRTADGERGCAEKTKTHGDVLFLIPDDFDRASTIAYFINNYYGLDRLNFIKIHMNPRPKNGGSVKIDEGNGLNLDMEEFDEKEPSFITELKADLEEYVKHELSPKYKFYKRNHIPFNLEKDLTNLKDEYFFKAKKSFKNYNIADFLTDKWLVDDIKALFEKYGE